MLSVGSRDDGRKRLGLGLGIGFGGGGEGRGRMEENELEEGEAFSGQEDDTCIDPDIDLSYIDEKLQDVLGHFQKDFDGAVSAENLGAKFGGYGSFLPSYQRSPSIWSQPRSPPRAPNHVSRSPNNPSFEGACQNPSAPTSASISKNNNALVSQSTDNSGKISTSKLNAVESVPQHDHINKPVNGSGHKSLKVRIKVGPESVLARNNAAIYSGLGLDISPSSSPENSPYGSGGLSPELQGAPDESPTTILEIMTRFPVPGGYLLSPLPDILFQLTKKESTYPKNRKTSMLQKGIPETCADVANLTMPVRNVKGLAEKKIKSDEKIGISMEVKNSDSKDDISTSLNREIDNETPEGQKLVSDALSISLLSGSRDADCRTDQQIIGDSTKDTSRMLDRSKKLSMISGTDRISSPELAHDNQLESTERTKNYGVGSSGNETTLSRGKLNSKTILEEKAPEEINTSNFKETSSDKQREHTGKVQKNYDIDKADSIGYKGRKNEITGIPESLKQMSAQKATSYEQDGERTLLKKDQLSKGKRKLKESQTNGIPVAELTKEILPPVSSVGSKEKKISHARGHHSKNKSKALKSSKEMSRVRSKESHRNAVGHVIAGLVGSSTDFLETHNKNKSKDTDFLETHNKNKSKDVKLGHAKGSVTFTEMSNIRPGGKKVDNSQIIEAAMDSPVNTPLTCNGTNPDAAAASHVPVVIKENWVACDICQEWRLLPYGTNPDHLPKKWQCSMQTWLPGLNKCHISEAVTTKALNALYQIPAPESESNMNGHHEVAASTITSADVLHVDQSLEHVTRTPPSIGKKKHGLKDESNVQNFTRSLNDVHDYSSETNLPKKYSLGRTSKSSDFTTEKTNHKQKEKHKIQERYSDGGDFIEKNGKHSKSKNKREVDEDGFISSKKIKKEDSNYPVRDSRSNLDLAGKAALIMDNGLSTKANMNILPAYIKSSKDHVNDYANGKFKEHFRAPDLENSGKEDFSAKRRKIREWQANQCHQETLMSNQHMLDNGVVVKEALSQSELKKQKKAKVSKSEEKESGTSTTDGRMDKGCSTRILLSGSREHPLEGKTEGKGFAGKEQQGQNQGSAVSQRALDSTDYLKRNMDYAEPAAATSSSSKVSGSQKSKANFQEARGSPVESVSSSPLRSSSTGKLSTRRNSAGKDNVTNVGFSVMGSLRRCSDGEVDGGSDLSGTRRKETTFVEQRPLESQRAAKSGVLDSLRRSCDLPDKEANQFSVCKAEDGIKSSPHDDLSPPEFEDINPVNTENILNQHNRYDCEGPDEDHIHDQHKMNTDRCANGPNQRNSGKSSALHFKQTDKRFKSDFDKGKLKVSNFVREQKESNTTRNGGSYETDIDSHDCSTYHEDLRDENYNAKEKKDKNHLGKKDSSVKWSVVGSGDVNSEYGMQDNLDDHGLTMLPKQHKDFDSRVAGASCSKSNLQENLQEAPFQQDEKSSDHFLSDRVGRSEMGSGRGKSRSVPLKDKHEAQSWGPQAFPTLVKGSKSELQPIDAVNGDATKVVKQSRKPGSQSSLRQATPSCPDASSPIRKDGHPAATVLLKEARDLKHTANRLKKEGLELESTGLYFEAALKFLHVASLLEPPTFEGTKNGEATMQMYSETARLCEFCAHEYERCKEMAAAALAYKCVEVAYMKAAYYKHPNASKDRHELQAALQIVPPGDSPSSSASDVDNLNNQGTLDKTSSAKGTASPQIAGNHVITARNRPNFMRLLNYSSDLNCAFEATRKSQNAIAAACVDQGNGGLDGLSLVKKVLDFNFYNVEGLLRLVRLAMESISR